MYRRLVWNLTSKLHVSPSEFRMTLLAAILFMVGAMTFVWPNVKMVKLSYEFQYLQEIQRQLLRENQYLKLERNSLRSLHRVESLAHSRLGLRQPEKNQNVTVFLK